MSPPSSFEISPSAVLDRGGSLLRPDCNSLRANDLDVAKADEAEDAFEIGLLMFEGRRRRAFGIDPAARGGDDHSLAAGEALDAFFGIAEGFSGDQEAVDPRLELA